jgi:hypothetical protein
VAKQGIKGRIGALAIVTALALAGCGGGNSGSTAETDSSGGVALKAVSMPKDAYTKKANELCVAQISKIAGVVQNALVANTPIKVKVILPTVEGMLTELTALGAPNEEKPQAEAFLAALQKDLDQIKGRSTASTTQLAADFKESGDLAAKIKLEACELG